MLELQLINADLLLVFGNFDLMGSCNVNELSFEVLC